MSDYRINLEIEQVKKIGISDDNIASLLVLSAHNKDVSSQIQALKEQNQFLMDEIERIGYVPITETTVQDTKGEFIANK